jgi:hypothetical protein
MRLRLVGLADRSLGRLGSEGNAASRNCCGKCDDVDVHHGFSIGSPTPNPNILSAWLA